MICSAKNGPGYEVSYKGIYNIFNRYCVNKISCAVLKDQEKVPYYKYNYCTVTLKEGTYSCQHSSKKFTEL